MLVDEDGVEHHFSLFHVVEVEDSRYALLQSADDEEELVILRIEGAIEEGNLVTPDDEEWDRVAEAIDGMGLLDDDFDDDFDDDAFDDDDLDDDDEFDFDEDDDLEEDD